MKKIFFLSMALILVLLGCSKNESSTSIRYGGQYYPGEFLLKGHDFFSSQGIAVNHILFSSGSENNEALISGNIDVNVGSDSKSVALFNAYGDNVVIIGTVQRGNRYSTLIHAEAEYTDWSELKGKTVGTRLGSGAEFVLRKYFDSREDLNWDDFNWVNIKTEDMIAALDNKKIEAFTVWAPTGEVAESMGIGKVLRSFGDVAQTPVSIHTTKSFLAEHREDLIKFLQAHLEKARLIKEDPEAAARYAAKAANTAGMQISEDAFLKIFTRINFQIDFDESLVQELNATANFLKEQGKIESIPNFVIDASLIKEAKSRLDQ